MSGDRSMNCESKMDAGNRFLKGKPDTGQESDSPRIKVYVASCFDEYEAAKSQEDVPSRLNLQVSDYPNYNPENNDFDNLYTGTEYLEGEDGERSWFNAGVRVGVGIGLSICVGIGIGVGLAGSNLPGNCQKLQRAPIIAYTILVGLSSPTSSIYAPAYSKPC
ncbi:Uncharacterized protein LOK49_LG02G03656 [Camellia lanceoleosa]|uniref:Uncharacterized protein n=1 Tax=Camellia lanceoleosa TaxID=1840588 RepID=A0ACC0IPL3_9ERIC|nr:Uncharacterized protein LOK49_LG02G03656 [Camellia lanceoleosa]